jgi:UPF0755 protein
MVAFIRFVFKTTLLLAGALAVVFLFAAMQSGQRLGGSTTTSTLTEWGNGPTTVVIYPGWRLEEIAQSLLVNNIMDGQQFYRLTKQGANVDHNYLNALSPDDSYEGYLFPGIYNLPAGATPEDLIMQMVTHLADSLPPNAAVLAERQGLTLHEAIILASIVEREAALDNERPLIASVYLNRLQGKTGHRLLQADPTVQYAMGYQEGTGQWWKSPVSLDEYSGVDDPYNTYLYEGLPPGPICNPGLSSIMAVLNPARTDYVYFVCANPGCAGGEHVFADSYDDHLRNVAAYYEQ